MYKLAFLTQNDSIALNRALDLYTYEEVQKDPESIQLLLKGVKLKNPQAIYLLAMCYYNGTHVPQDYTATVKLTKKIQQKHGDVLFAKSRYLLGQCYYNGFGVEQDKERALRYYRNGSRHNRKEREKQLKALGY